ncbi:MAG: NAD-binding protein [Actinobacteria bacterium]|nr:NAD-binding protein [Actinomycetota bacterium]
MPSVPRLAGRRDHFIVAGDDALARRVVQELTTTYGRRVTALVPSRESGQAPHIARLPRVRIVERPGLDDGALTDAQVGSAQALAILGEDDLHNFHAALRAQELSPGLRLVVAVTNTGLGERMRAFFPDCAVLSKPSMAAPAFVAAALGEPAPSHIRLAGRTLYVARRAQVSPASVVCGLATDDQVSPRLLPPDEQTASIVLAVADGVPRDPLTRRHRARAAARLVRSLVWHKFGIAFMALFAVLVAGFVLLVTAAGRSPGNALYLTFLDAAGAAVTNPALTTPEKVAQFLLTFDGMAFLPVVTAAVVGARLTGSLRGSGGPLSGHVIVAGLGQVGTRVVGQLYDLGVAVIGVDKNPEAAGTALARRLKVRVITGETHREETLRAAGITSCQSLVLATSSDTVNLETALVARGLAPRVRMVLRLGDDDLAARVQATIGGTISRSPSYLAAPAFAAAMLEHQVLRTLSLGRHVLLIADVSVAAGAELAGRPLEQVHQSGEVRVIALRRPGANGMDWSPAHDHVITPGEGLYVLATRRGLSRVLARTQPPTEPEPARA